MNEYKIYICDKNGSERGAYTVYATSYLNAAINFGRYCNKVNPYLNSYISDWVDLGRTKGNPTQSTYTQNSNNDKLLIVKFN